jgi:signal transduction histidine kinase
VTDDEGEVTHFVGFLQDVSDEKEHEQTIERRLDEFGDLLAQQLRPPLDSARETLRTDGDDDERIERAVQSIDRADRLVEDLAAVNRFSVKSREVSESVTEGNR